MEVDVDQPLPIFDVRVQEAPDQTDSGVVDQQVDLAEMFEGRVREPNHRIGIGHVDLIGQHLDAQLLSHSGGAVERCLVDVT